MQTNSPPRLFTREKVYTLDRLAIEVDAQAGEQLMFRAALSVWRNIQLRWPQLSRVVVLAGSGNNGGDAYAVADLARRDGVEVQVITMGNMQNQSPESAGYRQRWLEQGGGEQPWTGQLPESDLIVDGLLGIGLNKSLDRQWQELVDSINSRHALRASIDIPSGLNANTGSPQPVAVRADLTVTFIGRKIGCFSGDGPDYCGELVFDDLGISGSTAARVSPSAILMQPAWIDLPEARLRNSHKNSFGHVLVVGGAPAFSGAALLAGEAALRSGTGLVSLSIHPDSRVQSTNPELMISDWRKFDELAAQASVLVVGPGLGHSDEARALLRSIKTLDKPMVIDADALQTSFLDELSTACAVLTPHPGEAARLLGSTSERVQQDRMQALLQMQERWNQVVVLKGSGTLVSETGRTVNLCRYGHAGMATAGTGDVLAGVIGGLIAQGMSPGPAARSGVLLHALAAEAAGEDMHTDCLIASDITNRLGSVLQQVRKLQGGC